MPQKRLSDNSHQHPYTRPAFWVRPEKNWFWDNDKYTTAAREYFMAFVVEQDKILNRKWK